MADYDYKTRLKTKYPYLTDDDVDEIIGKAQMFYYNIVYKGDLTADQTSHPICGTRNEMWILAACDELVEKSGISSATAYKENGLSIEFDNAQLSLNLINMLAPIVGVIK